MFSCFDEKDYNYKKSKYTVDILVSIFKLDEMLDTIPINIFLEIGTPWSNYRKRIIFFLEEIVDDENIFNLHWEFYLQKIYSFSRIKKLSDENAPQTEIIKEFMITRGKDEEIEFNKFLQVSHSKMIEKLTEEDEMFRKKIESLYS